MSAVSDWIGLAVGVIGVVIGLWFFAWAYVKGRKP